MRQTTMECFKEVTRPITKKKHQCRARYAQSGLKGGTEEDEESGNGREDQEVDSANREVYVVALFGYQFVCLSVCLSVSVSVCLCVCVSVYLSVCLSVTGKSSETDFRDRWRKQIFVVVQSCNSRVIFKKLLKLSKCNFDDFLYDKDVQHFVHRLLLLCIHKVSDCYW